MKELPKVRIRLALGLTDPLVPEIHVMTEDGPRRLSLHGVSAVHLVHEVGRLPRAWVEFLGPDAEVVAELSTKDRELAGRFLAQVERDGHPHAKEDPVRALGQVAVDFRTAFLLEESLRKQALGAMVAADQVIVAARAAARCAGGHKYAQALADLWGAVGAYDAAAAAPAERAP